jgi:hypothetical protein
MKVFALRDKETSSLLDTNGELYTGSDKRKSVRFHGRKSDARQVLKRFVKPDGLEIVEFTLYGVGDAIE